MRLFVFLLALVAATAAFAPASAWAGERSSICHAVKFAEKNFTVCEIDFRRHAVKLFWKDPEGRPYRFLSKLPSADHAAGPLLFASNAGMFRPDLSPAGLYVENGRQFTAANTASGRGNFHKKPNGVFYVTDEGAGVAETGAFLKRRIKARFATQSGPMLVINGRLHPAFREDSASFKMRDGVGVRDGSTAYFVISNQEVTFSDFARLFRDELRCPNALFLDGGSVPTLYYGDTGRGGNLFAMGPMLGVFERPGGRQ